MLRAQRLSNRRPSSLRGPMAVVGFVVVCGLILVLAPRADRRGPEPPPSDAATQLWQALQQVQEASDSLAQRNYGETQLQLQRARATLTELLAAFRADHRDSGPRPSRTATAAARERARPAPASQPGAPGLALDGAPRPEPKQGGDHGADRDH